MPNQKRVYTTWFQLYTIPENVHWPVVIGMGNEKEQEEEITKEHEKFFRMMNTLIVLIVVKFL